MPVLLKDIKKELEKDRSKVGLNSRGEYKFTPPNIVSRKLADYTDLKISKFNTNPKIKLNAIDYVGAVSSETLNRKYKVTVRFVDMYFSKELPLDKSYTIEDEIMSNGIKVKIFYPIIRASTQRAMFKCACQDFRHRFETELSDIDSLIGRPREYTRETPPWPIGRPYANVTHKVGICKHVNSMINHLKSKKFLRE